MKVLLVDDSSVIAAYVKNVLEGEPDIHLLGPATDGARAIEMARRERPDVILMDLELPVVDGLTAIWEIMCSAPVPIVVLSAHLYDDPGRNRAFEAFEAGAVEVLAKPRGLRDTDVARFRRRVVRTLRVMAGAQVVTRRGTRPGGGDFAPPSAPPTSLHVDRRVEAVAVGSSTGGPIVLHEVLSALPAPYPLPILVAQHIVPGFEQGFADWLRETGHPVSVVQHGVPLAPGVYVAPADGDLRVVGDIVCRTTAVDAVLTPSVDTLFHTANARFPGSLAAVLLSGMGDDGARGLLEVRRAGGITVAQSERTCVVGGMPGAARALAAAELDLDPPEIANLLLRIGGRATGAVDTAAALERAKGSTSG